MAARIFSFLVEHYYPQHARISRRGCESCARYALITICGGSLRMMITTETREQLLRHDKVPEAAAESEVNFCEGDA
jgi:hypothetical protein